MARVLYNQRTLSNKTPAPAGAVLSSQGRHSVYLAASAVAALPPTPASGACPTDVVEADGACGRSCGVDQGRSMGGVRQIETCPAAEHPFAR
jgi:hypothetical protein